MDSLYISIIEKIKGRFSEGFSYLDLLNIPILSEKELKITKIHLHNTLFNLKSSQYNSLFRETIFTAISPDDPGSYDDHFHPSKLRLCNTDTKDIVYSKVIFTVSLETEFKYIDYQELKFARENAEEARKFSIIAIVIAIISVFVAILMPLIITQTVNIDDEQFKVINKVIENKK